MSALRGQGGHYDLRQGVSSYAPIIGTLGALAVPAIILIFTVHRPSKPHVALLITFAAGLLIVATITSLIGAIGFAAIGSETEPSANIPAAVMFVGVSVVTSVVDILAAFEVLSAVYLQSSETLFAVIAGIGGITGVFFMGFAISDSWHMGPAEPMRTVWLRNQWIQSRRQAQWHAVVCGSAGVAPIVLGLILRPFVSTPTPAAGAINSIVVAGLVLALAATIAGNVYASHPVSGIEAGLRWQEAYGSIMIVALYVMALLLIMPAPARHAA